MEPTFGQAYSAHMVSFVSSLEADLQETCQLQAILTEAILKADKTSIFPEELKETKAMMDQVSQYNTKLLSMKANISMLTGRSKQLIDKAEKLKEVKLNYLSQIDTIRKIEQEKDQIIAAKPSSPAITAIEPSASIPKIKSIVKKKKKSKAREALLDEEGGDWTSKRK